jgi:YwiC-like protein
MNLPREHGAWGILLIPFATAVGIAGVFNAPVALLLASVLCFYLARTSFLKGDYRWMAGLLVVSLFAAMPVVFIWHRWWLVVFGVGVAPVALRRTDRGIAMQLAAVAGLTLTAPVAWYVASGSLGWPAWRLWLLNTLYFAGRVLYVKMHITAAIQRGASRLRLGMPTLAYHGALAVVAVCWWPIGLAFVPAMIHAFIGAARLSPVLQIKRLAWTEVVASVVFGTSLIVVTRMFQ